MFPKSVLNDIRDRISIVSFIGERIPLKRSGHNFKGRCPFHNEKTPSFNVNDEKGIYHCFGCGEGGDVFRFVMKFDGLGFAEAVRCLADRAGVLLPRVQDPALIAAEEVQALKRRELLRVNEIARDFFAGRLLDGNAGAKARGYLQHRGISGEFWTQHFLGYADNSWDSLAYHLKEKGAPIELAEELGLVKRREGGGHYDFFRDRIIFPIVSPRGDVLGFGGRDIGEASDGAKYMNSPDSLVYHKSNCVYGLDRAQGPIRSADHAILVEGYMDLIALHQAGIANVVAPLGTALTSGHLRLVSRYTRNLTVVFDGDEAGTKAAMRSLDVFIDAGLSPRVAALPGGEDPDSLVRKEGAEIFRRRIDQAPSLFEFFVDRTLADAGADAAGKVAAIGRIVPILGAVADPAQRGIYRRHVARRLDLDERSIEQAIAAQRKRRPAGSSAPAEAVGASGTARKGPGGDIVVRPAERMLVEMMLTRPDAANEIFREIEPADFEDEWCRTAVLQIHAQWKRDGKVNVREMLEEMGDAELASQLRQLSLSTGRWADDESDDLVRDCVARIRGRPLMARMERINEDIRRAEADGDEAKLMALMAEKKKLAAQTKR